ncbi:tRNA pseudouridine(38-40) synthase TruA [Haloferula sp. BvORR071]|uniref:tRNA pseudouridine(38-40) synthase TruA n=1 Tax=Haloferula sp. BvORR071 TaxID=1396141 RepID=UPI000551F39B|nr:tRNA pseudouridine(38-40) synthase TruA [Haloferula sp. BvORR071]
MKLKLTIAYDGTAYQGWQSQRSGRGVQDQLHTALAALFPEAPELTGSSRTDAGVHALGMVAHFETAELRMPLRHLPLALNALLPVDIRVLGAAKATEAFHARFGAKGKEYRYRIWNHAAMNPLLRTQAWHVPRALDLAAMQVAAALFVGQHDFRAFTAKRPGILGDSVRTLTRCEVRKRGPEITVVLAGPGFLYKMCRGIVGTLVQIGEGRYPAEAVREMLASRDRRISGVNAPAHGLVLQKVFYR